MAEIPLPRRAPSAADPPEGLFDTFWRRRSLILLSTLVALALGTAYVTWATRIYSSVARVTIERLPPVPSIGSDGHSGISLGTHVELFQSDQVLTRAVQSPEVVASGALAQSPDPVREVRRALSVAIVKDADVLIVTFESQSDKAAAGVVNAVVKAYASYSAEHRVAAAERVAKALREELVLCTEELQHRAASLEPYRGTSNAIAGPETHPSGGGESGSDVALLIRQASRLSDQLVTAQLERAAAQTLAQEPASAAMQRRLDAAREKERVLQQAMDRQNKLIADLVGDVARETLARLEVKRLERRCESLEARVQEVKLAMASDAPGLTVTEEARVETRPVRPRAPQVLAAAVALGALTGCGIALCQEVARLPPRAQEL